MHISLLSYLFHLERKALFVIKILKLYHDIFDHTGRRLDTKAKLNFKFYDVIIWETNNCNTHIAQYLKK